ncbi:uncharacterized protein TRIADDRAFT_63821 [Trichoplax adhaerens]|uniref:Ras GTPase-activating protein 3 n=1 Tax=Trichoplax adhaerens TaxID=10228 RepID=B3RUA9_TRIAD|nr:hypothetical protein TRIADDRAFT_63821 [Trichoplax adhaerens]EDV25301.1 hypothetical protein TRIADDRAFT_63821 [Trichoplax adhaerens]|eukprot:XP_002111334.1 hypothetical protein TRIADDRAFT_63821 [Trichoplax adhaerens]
MYSGPFYGEEFEFDIPRDFGVLSFQIHETDLFGFRKDQAIGKVIIRRSELHTYNGLDKWHPILPVDTEPEAQGKIRVRLKLQDAYVNKTCYYKLHVKVIEATDLHACQSSGTSDTFASVKLMNYTTNFDNVILFNGYRQIKAFIPPFILRNRPEVKRTKLWDNDLSNYCVNIELCNANMIGDTFMGKVTIPLQSLDLSSSHEASQLIFQNSYMLSEREGRHSGNKADLGSLRLKINYVEDWVFPSRSYDQLRKLIVNSIDCNPINSSPAAVLGRIVKDKIDAAKSLVKIFLHYDKVVDFLRCVAENEIRHTSDPNTLFRGNSLASKAIDEFMKIYGQHYLHYTLNGIIDEGNLQGYVERCFVAITCSAIHCPPLMCELFRYIKEAAVRRFPDIEDICFTSVSGFIFLRFFAPALLNPRLFQMRADHGEPLTCRTLTLISKSIQNLGNLGCVQSMKETYMETLNSMFLNDTHIAAVKNFLDFISSPHEYNENSGMPLVLKEGIMIKRAQGRRKKFGVKPFRKRYFLLTTEELSYAKEKGSEILCQIPKEDILAVERVDYEAFKMKLMFQIVQPNRPLYVLANNSVEERDWIYVLKKICQKNPNRLEAYHPGAFDEKKNAWICCGKPQEVIAGCTHVTSISEADSPDTTMHIKVDVDRELEKVYTLFVNKLEDLQNLREEAASSLQKVSDFQLYSRNELQIELTSLNDIIEFCHRHLSEHEDNRKFNRSGNISFRSGTTQVSDTFGIGDLKVR